MQRFPGRKAHFEHSHLIGNVVLLGVDKHHVVALANRAVDNLEICDYATEAVEHRVEYQRLERRVLIPHRRRDTLHYGIENFVYAQARACRGADYVLALAADKVNYLVLHLVGHGVGHVALVYHRDNLKVVLQGHVKV